MKTLFAYAMLTGIMVGLCHQWWQQEIVHVSKERGTR